MSQQELLNFVIDALQSLGIPFMLTGSHASSLQGEARATHDIDLIANLRVGDAPRLMAVFPEDRFYLSLAAIEEAIRTQRMFNLLELDTGEKVDFWILTDSEFDRSRFARRQEIPFGDRSAWVTSPEDTILMKLHWSKQSGGSEKQRNDARGIYELQAATLDLQYMQRWAESLEILDLWQRLQAEAEPWNPGFE